MMRAPTAWSVAVRQPDGGITARRNDLSRLAERNRWAKIPFIRGIFVLGESLTLGFKALSWSAQVATEEEEKPLTGAQIGWTMALAFALELASCPVRTTASVLPWVADSAAA